MPRPAAKIVLHYLSCVALCRLCVQMSVWLVCPQSWHAPLNTKKHPQLWLVTAVNVCGFKNRPLIKVEVKINAPPCCSFKIHHLWYLRVAMSFKSHMFSHVCECVYSGVSDVHVICQTDMLAHLCPGGDSKMRFREGKQFFSTLQRTE